MLVNIDPIVQDDPATPNLFNDRFAKITEVLNGNIDSDNIKNNAVTSAKIANKSITSDKLDLTLQQSGNGAYFVFGNFMIAWGLTNVSSTGTDITFPKPFTSAPSVTLTIRDPNDQTAWLLSVTETKFRAKQPWTNNPLPVSWIAIGTA